MSTHVNSQTRTNTGEFWNCSEILFLSSNHINGSIPTSIVKLRSTLRGLYLSENEFDGSIPSDICSLTALGKLWLTVSLLFLLGWSSMLQFARRGFIYRYQSNQRSLALVRGRLAKAKAALCFPKQTFWFDPERLSEPYIAW